MPLSSKELFKRSFIKQCCDNGLTNEGQILAVIEKQAGFVSDQIARLNEQYRQSQLPDSKVTSPLPALGVAGIAAPYVGGAALGVLGSKLKGNWLDEEDVKQQELTDELRRQTELARQYHRIGGASPQSF